MHVDGMGVPMYLRSSKSPRRKQRGGFDCHKYRALILGYGRSGRRQATTSRLRADIEDASLLSVIYIQPELVQDARPAVCWTVQSLQDDVVRTADIPFSQQTTLLYS